MGRDARKKRRSDKKRSRPKSRFQRFLLRFGWLLPMVAIIVGLGVLVVTYAFAEIKLPSQIQVTSSAEIFDRNGKPIGFYADEVRRFLLSREEIDRLPDHVGQAVISAEDREFYKHNGVSLRGIARAAWRNFRGGRVSQGGSTITQQYVKVAVLKTTERTISRKVKEAILAVKLAELDLVTEHDGRPPLLLLDDVFSELDPDRRAHLVRRISELPQAFVTTTTLDDLDPALRAIAVTWEVRGDPAGARLVPGRP